MEAASKSLANDMLDASTLHTRRPVELAAIATSTDHLGHTPAAQGGPDQATSQDQTARPGSFPDQAAPLPDTSDTDMANPPTAQDQPTTGSTADSAFLAGALDQQTPDAAPLLQGLPLEAMPIELTGLEDSDGDDLGPADHTHFEDADPPSPASLAAQAEPGSPLQAGPNVATPNTGIFFDPASRPRAGLMHLAAGNAADQEERRDRVAPRSPKTEAEYAGRVKSLYRAAESVRTIDAQMPPVVSPIDVVSDLIESASGETPKRSLASWGLYRAAMLWHLAAHRRQNEAYEAAYQMLAATKKPPGMTGGSGERRPRPAKKVIPERDLVELINTLGSMRQNGTWGPRTQYWLQAGIASGVRPGEWIDASWLDRERKLLQVASAKRKQTLPAFAMVNQQRRGNQLGSGAAGQDGAANITVHDLDQDALPAGQARDAGLQWRTIPIKDEDVLAVEAHLSSLHAELAHHMSNGLTKQAAMKRYYDMARKTLALACQRAWHGRKSYSLYTARSQFAANAKAEMSLNAVAGLMGQTNTRTAQGNYGPRSAAYRRGGSLGEHLTQHMTQGMGQVDVTQVADAGPTSPSDTPAEAGGF